MQQVRPAASQSQAHSSGSQYPLLSFGEAQRPLGLWGRQDGLGERPHPSAVSASKSQSTKQSHTPWGRVNNAVSRHLLAEAGPIPAPGFKLWAGPSPLLHAVLVPFIWPDSLPPHHHYLHSYLLGFLSWRYLSWICNCLDFSCFSSFILIHCSWGGFRRVSRFILPLLSNFFSSFYRK